MLSKYKRLVAGPSSLNGGGDAPPANANSYANEHDEGDDCLAPVTKGSFETVGTELLVAPSLSLTSSSPASIDDGERPERSQGNIPILLGSKKCGGGGSKSKGKLPQRLATLRVGKLLPNARHSHYGGIGTTVSYIAIANDITRIAHAFSANPFLHLPNCHYM